MSAARSSPMSAVITSQGLAVVPGLARARYRRARPG